MFISNPVVVSLQFHQSSTRPDFTPRCMTESFMMTMKIHSAKPHTTDETRTGKRMKQEGGDMTDVFAITVSEEKAANTIFII